MLEKLSENVMDKVSIDYLRNQVLKNAYGNDDTPIAALDPRVLIVWYLFFGRDTMWVAVMDTIFGKGFNPDSLPYVPYGNGAKFEMAVRKDTTKVGAPLNLFQAQTPYETYLSGINPQELANLKDMQSKLGKYCGLRVGDIEQPNNNAGNWE